jgi:hypothetical protein
MSELEEIVRVHVNVTEWIKLKKYDEHQIAVCMYHPNTEEKKKIIVQAFRGFEEEFPTHYFRVQSLGFTERKFKKKDERIAKWYFKELCKSLKNGIFIQEKPTERSRRRGY